MPAQDTSELKERILQIIKKNGPSLPVHIAREIGLSILFASAFLSELLSEKKLKISDMKVGSSPLYFLEGQEIYLEKFSQYLKNKEKDAFILLKKEKILEDSKQNPAIRVALRAIKDFAIPFKQEDNIFWRYFIVPEPEIKSKQNLDIFDKSKKENKGEIVEQSEKNKETPSIDKSDEKIIKKSKESPAFALNILKYLKENNIKLLEETEVKKREFLGIARIESGLGEIEIIIFGKNKKKISEKDLQKAVEISIQEKRIALFLSEGEIDRKAKEFYRRHKNIIKFFKI